MYKDRVHPFPAVFLLKTSLLVQTAPPLLVHDTLELREEEGSNKMYALPTDSITLGGLRPPGMLQHWLVD